MRTMVMWSCVLGCLLAGTLCAQNPREQKIKRDRENFADDENWVYNDLPRAMSEARKANKPLMVVFRCIP